MTQQTVGVIGLGLMGTGMWSNLLKAQFAVVGFDIDPARVAALEAGGGTGAGDAKSVTEAADVIITSLPSASAFEATMAAIADAAGPGQTIIDTSTLPVDLKERGQAVLADAGATLLDCPLVGGARQAIAGELAVLTSGDEAACQAVTPVLEAFGQSIVYTGDFGSGTKMKLIANLLVAIDNLATAEAFLLAEKAGLDLQRMFDVISATPAASTVFKVRGPLMVAGRYDDPETMSGTMMVPMKDNSIIESFAKDLDCPTPLLSATMPIYAAAISQGRIDQDVASLLAVLEQMAGHARD